MVNLVLYSNLLVHMVARILNDDFSNVVPGKDDGQQTKCYPTNDEKRQRIDKEEKILVISLPDTIIHPRTMMIKILKENS